MKCKVARITMLPTIDAEWDKPPWRDVMPLSIDNVAGEIPEHCPKTQVKIAYDDAALYVTFRVNDRYVRAVTAEHDGAVWRDSCVEFFFTPSKDSKKGYFNLEMNCGGTMLLHFQKTLGKDSVHIPTDQLQSIEIAHSLPKIIDPEIQEPVTWTVEYRLPFLLLEIYCPVERPSPGVVWRANFHKCGDRTSHPHWLAWSPVAIRDFHRPEDFGVLEFCNTVNHNDE